MEVGTSVNVPADVHGYNMLKTIRIMNLMNVVNLFQPQELFEVEKDYEYAEEGRKTFTMFTTFTLAEGFRWE